MGSPATGGAPDHWWFRCGDHGHFLPALGHPQNRHRPPCHLPLRGPQSIAFLRHLQLLYEIFVYSQRAGGILALEKDIDAPAKSQIFSRHPAFLADHATRDFVCDTLRMLVIGATTPRELDILMELDIDVQRRGQHEPVRALATVAESLPGMGIVAAVLGVVITMEAIGGSPESVGQKVAAALVGTFLGILLCYGVIGPLAARLESMTETQSQFFQVLRIAIMSFAQGASPILAIEYARRSIPVELRPASPPWRIPCGTTPSSGRCPSPPMPSHPGGRR